MPAVVLPVLDEKVSTVPSSKPVEPRQHKRIDKGQPQKKDPIGSENQLGSGVLAVVSPVPGDPSHVSTQKRLPTPVIKESSQKDSKAANKEKVVPKEPSQKKEPIERENLPGSGVLAVVSPVLEDPSHISTQKRLPTPVIKESSQKDAKVANKGKVVPKEPSQKKEPIESENLPGSGVLAVVSPVLEDPSHVSTQKPLPAPIIKESSQKDPKTANKKKAGPKEPSQKKVSFKLQRSPTGFETDPGKLSTANVASLNESLKSPKPFERKKREPVPGISAIDYIQETWESASSVATSAMTERTRTLLKTVSLNVWLDKDRKLLENYCANGKVQAVRFLLDKGCNPGRTRSRSTKDERRPGPILYAIEGASQKHNKCVSALIQHGVDVNVIFKRTGNTPLHAAIENPQYHGYERLVHDLIEAGADTNRTDLKNEYPIMKLFYGNDSGPLEKHRLKALALLLHVDTEVNIVLPGTLNTPLHLAVRYKDLYAVGMLLHKKANVNAKNASGTTPLLLTANQFQRALTNDQTNILKLLLETDGIEVDEKAGANQQTALHQAVKAGISAAVEMLLKRGASPHCKDAGGHDALALAMQHASGHSVDEHGDILAQLKEAMKKSWPLAADTCVLESACRSGDTTLMKGLLDDGLDPRFKKNDRPILQRAIGYGNMAVVELLTQRGAFANAKNENGLDAVAYAVSRNEDDIARFLVREGKYQRGINRLEMEKLEELITRRVDAKGDAEGAAERIAKGDVKKDTTGG